MSKAGKKIIDGLRDAIAIAKGEVEPARVHYPPLISDAVVEAALREWSDCDDVGHLITDQSQVISGCVSDLVRALRAAILADRAETVEKCCAYLDSIHHTNTSAMLRAHFSPSPSSKSASTAQEGGSGE